MSAGAQAAGDKGRRAPVADAAPVPISVRKAALLLHTLGTNDREWLVAQLADRDRTMLRPLLSELRALGIPVDRRLVDDAVAVARKTPEPPASGKGSAPSDAVRRAAAAAGVDAALVALVEGADPVRLAGLLRSEPPGLVARLLAIHAWPWSREVLAELGAVRTREIEESASRLHIGDGTESAPSTAPALSSRLLAFLVERLAGDVPGAPPGREGAARAGSGPAGWAHRALRRWVR